MCDFSAYGGASKELLDLLATEPATGDADDRSIDEIKRTINQGWEEIAADEMRVLAPQVKTQNHTIPTRDGKTIPARSYRPASVPDEEPLPIYIHYHGGGFLYGTLDSEDSTCARITLSTHVAVLNVNYRHTPEWKYPTAWHDAEDAFEWAYTHSRVAFVGDSEQIVVGGISAGAHLAAALALTKKREEAASYASLRGQVLMIPCLVHPDRYEPLLEKLKDPARSSYCENEFAPVLPLSRLNMFMGLLCPQVPGGDDRRFNVGLASAEEVQGLPPVTFGVAGLDPLRDEALLYAKLLAENDVATDVHLFRGVPHGFRRWGDKLSSSAHWDKVMHDGIRWALSHPPANIALEVHMHE